MEIVLLEHAADRSRAHRLPTSWVPRYRIEAIDGRRAFETMDDSSR